MCVWGGGGEGGEGGVGAWGAQRGGGEAPAVVLQHGLTDAQLFGSLLNRQVENLWVCGAGGAGQEDVILRCVHSNSMGS